MSSFKDFFSQQSGSPTLPSISDVSALIASSISSLSVLGGQMSLKQKEEFSTKVSSLAYSNEFIEELSSQIGKPQPDETEDEFVERAKSTMKKLLSQKLVAVIK